jgi:hypothetical protein
VSVAAYIEPILLVSGIVTAGAIAAFFAPRSIVRVLFRDELIAPPGVLLARHWGLLVSLVGCLIIYAAYAPALRYPILIVAVVEKAVLIALFFVGGVRWSPAMQAVAVIDGLFAALYIAYLAGF